MNILQCLLVLSALASLLVTGPNMVPVQANAEPGDNGDYKITKDYKSSIRKDVDSKSDSTNQHLARTTSATGSTIVNRPTKVNR